MNKHGWNAFRLRVFISPVRAAPNNSLENTIALAKQIKAAHAMFLLDIHYSDTWADPQHQEIPIPWRNLDVNGLEKQVEDYSKDVISQLKAANCMPEMVQVGNEITGGTLWPLGHVKVPHSDVKNDAGRIQPLPDPYDDAKQWDNFTRFIKAGVKGVHEGAGNSPTKIVIHIDCGGDWPITRWFFDHFKDAQGGPVDYDIIGQSYYPRYHGTLEGLQQNMIECQKRYGKPTMVVETGYPQAGTLTPPYMVWPASKDGQLQFMADLVNTVKRNNGLGVFYWGPEGRAGNGMWNNDGSPAPSIFVMDHLKDLTTQPASHLPADNK
jgi:arabinogalactan endo-1,4-beta-galactosidase